MSRQSSGVRLVGSAVMICALLVAAPAVPANQDRYSRAGALVDSGNFARALVEYQAFLKENTSLDDQHRSRVLNNIGFCHYKLGRLKEAREYYTRALEIAPDYTTCLNNLAVVLINEKRFAEALPHLERAFRLERTVRIAFNLFSVHYYADHRKEALSMLEEAMRLDAVYTEARLKAKNVKQSDIDKLRRRIR